MDLNFTPADSVAAARFIRAQAPRLPHAQRRAALNAAKMFEGGLDLADGMFVVSMPILLDGEVIGSVDFAVYPPDGEGKVPRVSPLTSGDDGYTSLFRWQR